jgi:CDGSH-type Zn-finger protein
MDLKTKYGQLRPPEPPKQKPTSSLQGSVHFPSQQKPSLKHTIITESNANATSNRDKLQQVTPASGGHSLKGPHHDGPHAIASTSRSASNTVINNSEKQTSNSVSNYHDHVNVYKEYLDQLKSNAAAQATASQTTDIPSHAATAASYSHPGAKIHANTSQNHDTNNGISPHVYTDDATRHHALQHQSDQFARPHHQESPSTTHSHALPTHPTSQIHLRREIPQNHQVSSSAFANEHSTIPSQHSSSVPELKGQRQNLPVTTNNKNSTNGLHETQRAKHNGILLQSSTSPSSSSPSKTTVATEQTSPTKREPDSDVRASTAEIYDRIEKAIEGFQTEYPPFSTTSEEDLEAYYYYYFNFPDPPSSDENALLSDSYEAYYDHTHHKYYDEGEEEEEDQQPTYRRRLPKLLGKKEISEPRPLLDFPSANESTDTKWPTFIKTIFDHPNLSRNMPKGKEVFSVRREESVDLHQFRKVALGKPLVVFEALQAKSLPAKSSSSSDTTSSSSSSSTSSTTTIVEKVSETIDTFGVSDSASIEPLAFESRFECGNLQKAVQLSPTHYELHLHKDYNTKGHTQWYYFRVSNMQVGVSYRFDIVNLMKKDSLYKRGLKPLMYSERLEKLRGVGWHRVGENVWYFANETSDPSSESSDDMHVGTHGNKNQQGENDSVVWHTLTFTISFEFENDTCYFAHCYPYSYTDLQNDLKALKSDPQRNTLFRHTILCKSLAGNNIDLITVTTPVKTPEELRKRKGIIVSSRVHPGETNSSWMMKGFLDFITSEKKEASYLRDHFVIKIVPMINPDGVIVGNVSFIVFLRFLCFLKTDPHNVTFAIVPM